MDTDVRNELQTSLIKTQRVQPKLVGLLRRYQAVYNLLLQRHDEALQDVEKYLLALRSWLDDFEERIFSSIYLEFNEKCGVISEYQKEIQTELDTLGILSNDAEELLKCMDNLSPKQYQQGQQMIHAFSIMLQNSHQEAEISENLTCLKFLEGLQTDKLPNLGEVQTKFISSNTEEQDKGTLLCSVRHSAYKINVGNDYSIHKVLCKTRDESCTDVQNSLQKRLGHTEANNNVVTICRKPRGLQGKDFSKDDSSSHVAIRFRGSHKNYDFIRGQLKQAGLLKVSKKSNYISNSFLEKSPTDGLGDCNSNVKSTNDNVCHVEFDRNKNVKSKEHVRNIDTDNGLCKQREFDKKCSALTNTKERMDLTELCSGQIKSLVNTSLNEIWDSEEEVKETPLSQKAVSSSQKAADNTRNAADGATVDTRSYTNDCLEPKVTKTAESGRLSVQHLLNLQSAVNRLSRSQDDSTYDSGKTRSSTLDENMFASHCVPSTRINPKILETPPETQKKHCLRRPSGIITLSPKSPNRKTSDRNNNACNMANTASPQEEKLLNSKENVSIENVFETGKNTSNDRSTFCTLPVADEGKKDKYVSESTESLEKDKQINKSFVTLVTRKDGSCDIETSKLTLDNRPTLEELVTTLDKNSTERKDECCHGNMKGINLDINENKTTVTEERWDSNIADSVYVSVASSIATTGNFISAALGFPSQKCQNPERKETVEIPAASPSKIYVHKQTEQDTGVNAKSTESVIVKHIKSSDKHSDIRPIPATLSFKFGTSGTNGDGMKFPIGVVTNSKKEIIVADTGNHVVKMFDDKGKFIREIGRKVGLWRPSALVVNKHDQIFVKDDVAVHVFTSLGEFLHRIGANRLNHPFGLALTPNDLLVTLDTDKRNPQVYVMSQDGRDINSFTYNPLLVNPLRSKCRFLAVHQHRLIVSDLGANCVYLTDNSGQTIRKIGSYGSTPGNFVEPSGVTTDHQGNIIVADSKNDRVQIFDPNGIYLCCVQFSEPIMRPSDIHMTNDGYLYITNFISHQIKVYKLG